MTFLKIAGGVALGILVVIVVVLVVVRLFLGRLFKQFSEGLTELAEAAGQLPPIRVTLVRRGAGLEWDDPDRLAEHTAILESNGFRPAGDFSIEEMDGVCVRGLVNPETNVVAAICEHPAGKWLDIVQVYEDDTCLGLTSLEPTGLHTPPWKTTVFERDADATRLLELFLQHRPDRVPRPVTIDQFAEIFEAWGGRIDESREQQLRERFLETTDMSAVEWDRIRDRVVFVHDQLDGEALGEIIAAALDWEDEDACDAICDEAMRLRESRRGRAAFAKMLAALPESRRHRKIGEVSEPIEADVFVGPEED